MRCCLALALAGLLFACGGDSAPHVVSFAADRSEVYAGGTVELSWRVVGAEAVEVSGPGGVLGSGLGGTAISPPLEEDTTFVLRADDVERSLTVKVRARPAVEVTRFGVSARWVAGTESVTVRWSTRFAESASLVKNDLPTALDSPVEGTTSIEVTAGDRLVLVAKSGAMEARSDEIVFEAAEEETETNDDAATADEITGSMVGNSDVGQVDVYRLAITAGAFPEIEIRGADGRCDVPLFVELSSSDGVALAAAGPGDGCPKIDPDEVWRTIGAIPPGDLFVSVYSADLIRYALFARAVPPECGNGRVEIWAGENREDGASTCRAPGTVDELEPNDTAATAMTLGASGVVMGGGNPESDTDWYLVPVPAGSSIVTTVFDEGMGRCLGSTPAAPIYSGGFFASVPVPSLCPTQVLTASSAVDQVVEVIVSATDLYQLVWNVAPIACGNGTVDPGEECDGGPGCESSCSIRRLGRVDTIGTFVFNGSLAPFGQAVVEVANTEVVHVSARLIAGSDGRCKESVPRMVMLNHLGGFLVFGDQRGPGLCAEIDPRRRDSTRALDPQERTIVISAGARPLDDFELTVTFARPRCGDGIDDVGESCDDGNTTEGDGCSNACRVDAATPIVLPIDNLFELPGLGSLRAFTVDVPAPGTLISVDTLRASGACFADTQPSILDPQGNLVARGRGFQCRRTSFDTQMAGTHTIVVQSLDGRPGWHVIRATAAPPVCGDARLAPDETCDDDATPGDGCTACMPDPGFDFETEPNDAPGSGPTVTASSSTVATFSGALWSGDKDSIRLELAIAANLELTTYGEPGDRESCGGDTVLRLLDDQGAELAMNDDDRSTDFGNMCSRLEIALQPGLYDVEVSPFGTGSVGFYFVDLEVTP